MISMHASAENRTDVLRDAKSTLKDTSDPPEFGIDPSTPVEQDRDITMG
jgi:hypothetical protein